MNGATLIGEDKNTITYACNCGLKYTFPKASQYQPTWCNQFSCNHKGLHPEIMGQPLRWLPEFANKLKNESDLSP